MPCVQEQLRCGHNVMAHYRDQESLGTTWCVAILLPIGMVIRGWIGQDTRGPCNRWFLTQKQNPNVP